MPPKKRKQNKNLNRGTAHYYDAQAYWNAQIKQFDALCEGLGGIQGKVRTFEENKLLLLVVGQELKLKVKEAEEWETPDFKVSWTDVKRSVCKKYHVDYDHIDWITKGLIDEGVVLVDDDPTPRGAGSPKYESKSKLTPGQLLLLSKHIDELHANGKSTSKARLQTYLKREFKVEVSLTTIGNYMKKMGLTYRKSKVRKRTLSSYRLEVIRDYLIKLDFYTKAIENGEDYVFVFMDESYCHQYHSEKSSWFGEDNHINKPSGNGRRLVIMHAITEDGPLCEYDEYDRPIDDLLWYGPNQKDSCRPMENRPAGAKLTCETLWIAQNKTGDYHDNMNSEMFMQWAQTKLLPCFERRYPGKKMVFVLDNAPYHRAREIGSLQGKSKKELVEMMKSFDCQYIDVPSSSARDEALDEAEVAGVTDIPGDLYRVAFNEDDFKARASKARPFIPSVEELQLGFVNWLKEHKKEKLECKFEALMKGLGHVILWTPPYCPDLQPIEIFWAAGKNRVAEHYFEGRSMRLTVEHLREGWYGNHFPKMIGPELPDWMKRKAVSCKKLVEKSVKMANTVFIPMCKDLGLSGTIGELTFVPTGNEGTSAFPIDMVVNDIAEIAEGEVEVDE